MPPVLQTETRLRSPPIKPEAAPNELTENAVAAVGAKETEKVALTLSQHFGANSRFAYCVFFFFFFFF